ncbi:MAG: heavy-metal-associated domain-containing protein [Elusimicrobia bacterium]|nr:heavy-metal-associated domain-containing protein [Elusimicrobiota bacterium]
MKPLFRILAAALALHLFSPAAQAESAKLSGAVIVRIKGMSCPMCTFGFKKRLKKLPGAETVRLDYKAGTALITLLRDAQISPDDIRKAVKDAGFEAVEIGSVIRSTQSR